MVASNQRGRHQGEQLVAVLHHSKKIHADVAFESKADIASGPRHVRFTPESGHRDSNEMIRFVPKPEVVITCCTLQDVSMKSCLCANRTTYMSCYCRSMAW